jgi:hypothetical protein
MDLKVSLIFGLSATFIIAVLAASGQRDKSLKGFCEPRKLKMQFEKEEKVFDSVYCEINGSGFVLVDGMLIPLK